MADFLSKAPLYLAAAYIGFIGSFACIPALQRSLIYLHQVKLPLNAQFDNPSHYGHARKSTFLSWGILQVVLISLRTLAGKVRNLYFKTPDGIKLGAWHVLPDSIYSHHIDQNGFIGIEESVFDEALKSKPVVLYFHGNAATRAASNRVRVGRLISATDRNFILIDYRGFGDSTGAPSEIGLNTDARTAWNFLISKGVKPSNINIMGQSLGTGVSVALVESLSTEGVSPHSLTLVAPFSSIKNLLETIKVFGIIPVTAPLKSIPRFFDLMGYMLETKFNSISKISSISCPILLLHAENDNTIPFSHSQTLFAKLREKSSPKVEKWEFWGTIHQVERLGKGRVVFGLALTGDHNNIGSNAGSIRLIEDILK